MLWVPKRSVPYIRTDLYLEIFRLGPVTHCRPEPPCVVTDIPKHVLYLQIFPFNP